MCKIVDIICCPICCPIKTCCYICTFLTVAVLVTVGVLIAFLVQKPSASVSSYTFACTSQPQCLSLAQTSGIPVLVTLSVHNPNIISGDVYSDDLALTDPNNAGAVIGSGYFNSTHISSRTDSDIVAPFIFPPGAETVKVATALYSGHSYPVHIQGDLHISIGALSFTYTLNDDDTIPAQ